VSRLRAHLDGFDSPSRGQAVAGAVDAASCVVPVPAAIDAQVANACRADRYQ
jgi:hypothetical protein